MLFEIRDIKHKSRTLAPLDYLRLMFLKPVHEEVLVICFTTHSNIQRLH